MAEFSSDNFDLEHQRYHLKRLVSAVYKVTAHIPESETMRNKLREESLNALAHGEHFYAGGDKQLYNKFIASVHTLIHYCEIAGGESWVDKKNFDILKNEFFRFRNILEEFPSVHNENYITTRKKHAGKTSSNKASRGNNAVSRNSSSLTDRQEKLIHHLKENGNARLADLENVVPEKSRKTIKRDLDKLIDKNLVIKEGTTNGTVYKQA